MLRYLRNTKGLTLPEVLITLVLVSIVSLAIYAFLFNGLHSYQKISAEAAFRDEADVVMTSFINTLYPIKENEITSRNFDSDKDTYLLTINKSTTIGFKNGNALLNGTALNGSSFDLAGSSIEETSSGNFQIRITIKDKTTDHAKPLTLISEIGLITEGADEP
ncbi:prepilin-type N-terminal cleavage/methylation domain-containing protein [Alkalihalobacillus sp. CinArs1]|uniref:prepilin-type N-terminal cleavage/methylation domain-containing protein n=1 Tax=Alkalihalobacillus sp. CinArs1 TaxID=2995314 RepID=UPI0022DDC4F9|nr:prepilin-type N-terminal cleavage/methylation domain-containing protein [Alkalihalobacillus sp. CinArs1]